GCACHDLLLLVPTVSVGTRAFGALRRGARPSALSEGTKRPRSPYLRLKVNASSYFGPEMWPMRQNVTVTTAAPLTRLRQARTQASSVRGRATGGLYSHTRRFACGLGGSGLGLRFLLVQLLEHAQVPPFHVEHVPHLRPRLGVGHLRQSLLKVGDAQTFVVHQQAEEMLQADEVDGREAGRVRAERRRRYSVLLQETNGRTDGGVF